MTNTFENGMDDIEARGYLATTKFYEAMRDVEKENIATMQNELDELTEKMSQAVNSGEIKEGSQSWYEMQQNINDVKEAIQEAETAVIEFGNSIREVLWDRFDYLQDRISEITDEADFMIDLMSNSKMHTDEGYFTSEGMATLGLHAQNYDILMNQADRYAAEVKKLNAEIAKDPNNTLLLEQRQEWIESQREAILNAEEEKQAMIDLARDGVQLELDKLNELINTYKESLDSAKSLYDYQKKVNEQANNIASIQKRISAYAGDNSEETRSTVQKLSVDLTKAQQSLLDTQYQRQISETKSMLSDLYTTYEMIVNSRLDNVDALLSDLIQMVNLNSGSTRDSIAALQNANGGYVNVINGQISYVGGNNDSWLSTLNNTTSIGLTGLGTDARAGLTALEAATSANINAMGVGTQNSISTLNASNQIGFNGVNTGFSNISGTLSSIYNGNSSNFNVLNSTDQTGFQTIKDTLNIQAENVGYTLSEPMQDIWNNISENSVIVDTYGNLMSSGIETTNGVLDTINNVIGGIATNVANMAHASDVKAAATVKATTKSTATNTAAKPVTPPVTNTPKKEAPKKQEGHTDQEKYGVAIAIWNGLQGWGAGEDRKKKLQAKGFNYDEVQGIVSKIRGDIISGQWNGKYYGITYNDIPNYAYNKFKSGGIVDYTGLAQVDGTPGRPEAFLNAEDTKNFTVLKDTLHAIMSGRASLSGSSASLGLFAGLTGISRPQGIGGNSVGNITYQINIPIDHVADYDDFVNKMRSDTKFEKLIQSMTIGQLSGQSNLAKNKYKW